jgi:hypothetical protein
VHSEIAFVLFRPMTVGAGTFQQGLHLFEKINPLIGSRGRRKNHGEREKKVGGLGEAHKGRNCASPRAPVKKASQIERINANPELVFPVANPNEGWNHICHV